MYEKLSNVPKKVHEERFKTVHTSIGRGLAKREDIKNMLLNFQSANVHVKQNGGFSYGIAVDGSMKTHLNAWCTMFAVQSLWMYQQFVQDNKPLSLECII